MTTRCQLPGPWEAPFPGANRLCPHKGSHWSQLIASQLLIHMVNGEAVYSSKTYSYKHSSVQEHCTDGARLDSTTAVLHSRDAGLWSWHISGCWLSTAKRTAALPTWEAPGAWFRIQVCPSLTNTLSSVLSCQPLTSAWGGAAPGKHIPAENQLLVPMSNSWGLEHLPRAVSSFWKMR